MNRIDELFKNKLANHPVAPSADAWQKVEAGLTKKNNAWVWRLAAALVLFGLVSGAWYMWSKNAEVQPELVQQPLPSPQKEIPVVVQPEEQKQNLVAETETKSKSETLTKKKTTKTNTSESKKEIQPEKEKVEEPQVVLSQTEVLVAEHKTEPTPARKPIVIEFTLDAIPVNMTEPEVVVANADDDKSGLQKILEKARDIKNGDSELGSLRDVKNELFALDFRKDKTKRN